MDQGSRKAVLATLQRELDDVQVSNRSAWDKISCLVPLHIFQISSDEPELCVGDLSEGKQPSCTSYSNFEPFTRCTGSGTMGVR